MGHPIGHSKSPFIHTRFAEQTGQSLSYLAIHVLPGEFARALAAFRAEGGKGLSITLPFKQEAGELVDRLSPRARRANAVNTIRFDDSGEMQGDNTDGIGLIRDLLLNHGMQVAGRQVLLLGAGGAARGVLGPLLDEGPERLVIANRTPEKARALAGEFLREGDVRADSLKGCGFGEIGTESFHLILNATSASIQGEVPPLPEDALRENGWCYDFMYDASRPTEFVSWGKRHGASRSVDGLGMLVEQAAEAFCSWRGIRPDTGPVIETLRREERS